MTTDTTSPRAWCPHCLGYLPVTLISTPTGGQLAWCLRCNKPVEYRSANESEED